MFKHDTLSALLLAYRRTFSPGIVSSCRFTREALSAEPSSFSISAMPVPMMHVGIMGMAMGQRFMCVLMNVRLGRIDARRMFMLMVFLMGMPVTMNEPFMSMLVRMSLRKIQP